MKTRMFQWMMAATLICGAAFFTACIDKNDDPYGPVIENLDQKIVGKWIVNDLDGQQIGRAHV